MVTPSCSLSFLRLECVRGSPERAGVEAVGVKREDLVVELLCCVRGLGDAVEVAEVLARLFDDLRGGDPARAGALARQNLALRQTPRARALVRRATGHLKSSDAPASTSR